MAQIRAIDITSDFLTSQGGLAVGKKIESLFRINPSDNVEISFDGILRVAPSFVNGAFLYLIDNYGDEYFRNHVKVVNSSAEVARIIGESVRSYLNHQRSFYDKLRTNTVYFANDNSTSGNQLLNILKDASQKHGFRYSVNPSGDIFTSLTRKAIKESDALIAVIAEQNSSELLDQQMQSAIDESKPCIVLQKRNVNLRVRTAMHSHIQVFYFDDSDYLKQLHELNLLIAKHKKEVLQPNTGIPSSNGSSDESVAAAGLLVIAFLAALFFSAIGDKDKNDRN